MSLIIHGLLIVNQSSIWEGCQLNQFQGDTERREAKSHVVLSVPEWELLL